MKNIKKATAIIMGATIIMSSAAMVMADSSINASNLTNAISVQDNINKKVTIKSIETEDGISKILVTPLDENPMDIMLNISEDTKVDLSSLSEGDTILATYSNVMTRSIPPQTNAIEITKENADMDNIIVSQPSSALALVNLNAIISEIIDSEGNKSILVDDSNSKNSQISLNINNNTIIMKPNGEALNFNELKAGDKINVVHSPAMTFSLPPQTYSYAIIVNNEQVAVPQYIEVENVTTENDTTTIESKDGNYIIRVNKDTEIVPFNTKNIVKAQDIVKGTAIFAWYDILTASIPAQATANKVMILPEVENTLDKDIELDSSVEASKPLTVLNKVIINGEQLDLGNKEIKISGEDNNFNMIPLRPVAEKLGFNVGWNKDTNSVELDKGTVKITLSAGQDKYIVQYGKSVADEKGESVGIAPVNIGGDLYVPANLFNLLTQDAITIVDGTLNININK